jgi:hypothetical protein
LWFSIMERENVLNALNGRPGFYSLFRTHHTVAQVAVQMGDFGTGAEHEDAEIEPSSSAGDEDDELDGASA